MKRRLMMAGSLLAGAADVLPAAPGRVVEHENSTISLPPPIPDRAPSLHQALQQRRSVRSYSTKTVALPFLSQLLWAAQGTTTRDGRRTAPSAGALYPLELHVVAVRVDGLQAGVYRYVPGAHQLKRAAFVASLAELAAAAFDQEAIKQAAAVVVFAAVEGRTAGKYGGRASRFVAFETGAASQNLALQAAALGLGTVVIGAFEPDAVARVLRLPRGEAVIAMMPVGML